MDTRVCTFNSGQSQLVGGTTSDFELYLTNLPKEFTEHVVGISVESVGFTNLVSNIPSHIGTLEIYFSDGVGGEETKTFVLGEDLPIDGAYVDSWWDVYSLADQMQLWADSSIYVAPGTVTFTVVSGVTPDGLERIAVEWTTAALGSLSISAYQGFSKQLGVDGFVMNVSGATNISVDSVNPGPYNLRTQLEGPQHLKVEAQELVSGKNSLNGDSSTGYTIINVPLNEVYGGVVNLYSNGDTRPTVKFTGITNSSLTTIGFRLAYPSGETVNLHGSPMYITTRMFINQ
jgi:hypothetical protein